MGKRFHLASVLCAACLASGCGALPDPLPIKSEASAKSETIATAPRRETAADKQNSDAARFAAMVRVVEQYAELGMPLNAFCLLIDNPKWLKKTNIVDWSDGAIRQSPPLAVDPTRNSATFSIIMEDGPGNRWAIHFRVSEKIAADTLWKMIQGESPTNVDDAAVWINATVLEIVASVVQEGKQVENKPVTRRKN